MAAEHDRAQSPEPVTVRIPEAMRMLGLGRSKLYELIGDGQIATIKVGRSRLVVMRSIHDFVEQQTP
ncbi:helix-turn-helix domain-containing protein [Flavisphingomonas formosensis]|uniref:helix-turn-helix domain-containing protein n=1 Tax=Flavisphingomonas formosensis TaxID=861534 RepID=UPI0012FBCF85|nr:helix-turn-helix domain-containing protein [Sphingomonas formosensis]